MTKIVMFLGNLRLKLTTLRDEHFEDGDFAGADAFNSALRIVDELWEEL